MGGLVGHVGDQTPALGQQCFGQDLHAAAEVGVQRPCGEAGGVGDVLNAGVGVATLKKHLDCGSDEAGACVGRCSWAPAWSGG